MGRCILIIHLFLINEMNQSQLVDPFSLSSTSEVDEYLENGYQSPKTNNLYGKFKKPDIPYVNLIIEALEEAAPKTMLTLPEIYKRIMIKYPYYRMAPARWKVRFSLF